MIQAALLIFYVNMSQIWCCFVSANVSHLKGTKRKPLSSFVIFEVCLFSLRWFLPHIRPPTNTTSTSTLSDTPNTNTPKDSHLSQRFTEKRRNPSMISERNQTEKQLYCTPCSQLVQWMIFSCASPCPVTVGVSVPSPYFHAMSHLWC